MLFVLASLSGCGSTDDEAPSAHGIYVVPASLDALSEETFFDHPWPSDFRHEADGSVRFIGFPNPREKPILAEYVDSMAGVLTAFSPAAAGYLRFTEALDPDSLPATPLDALEADSSVQLIDVDPTQGIRMPKSGAKLPELLSRQEIGVKLDIGVKTGDYHLQQAKQMVGVANLRLLHVWATEHLDELLAFAGEPPG